MPDPTPPASTVFQDDENVHVIGHYTPRIHPQ